MRTSSLTSTEITVPGWQSWTPCRPQPKILTFFTGYSYSPFGQTEWVIPNPPQIQISKPIAGWCSYYAFGPNINEQKIISNAEILAKKISPPLDTYVVVDDGWCNWGDWNHPSTRKFPHDLKYTCDQIRSLNLKPAIWIAPFLSNLPTPNRLKVFPFNYIQDMENPEVFNSIMNTVEILVEKYQFDLLKFDFLYALHHLSKYSSSVIPDEILHKFLSAVRQKYPHIHINACGCPLGPAIGNCDSMRISADNISPYLDNLWPINSLYHGNNLNQLEINLNRRENTRQFWLLDPDAFSCRKSNGLTNIQIVRLRLAIQKAKGLYFLGDDLTKLSEHEIKDHIQPLFENLISS
jgi:alpha-galactosidase